LSESLGGTDGFRAHFTDQTGPGLMNPETIAGLSYALIIKQTHGQGGGEVVIGMDPRPLNRPLELAAIAGAEAAGAEIIRMGVTSTPSVLRTAQRFDTVAAEVITASHNGPKYGGWKGTFGSDKPYGDEVSAIDEIYWEQVRSGLIIPTTPRKEYELRPELLQDYMDSVVDEITNEFGEHPLEGKIFVYDGANGAAMDTTPIILERLGGIIKRFACDPSKPINENSGANDLNGVKEFLSTRPDLVKNPNFIGVLSNDGDADRFMGVGAELVDGEVVCDTLDGNRVMELMAIGQPGIVGTEYTNNGSMSRVAFELCPNGDVYVTHKLRELQAAGKNWTRGGEFTGHHVDLTWLSSGDGIRMASWVAAYAVKNDTTLMELCKQMPLWPETMRKLALRAGMGQVALYDNAVQESMQLTPEEQAAGVRLVVRESGTEKDNMRIWGVGQDAAMVNARTQEVYSSMSTYAA
jgi:phosphoglucosamine mutase